MHRFSVRTNRAQEVRWWDWGPEAFRAAQEQDRPVILCLTAFWCGFCQRMDETTFSHDDVIALLNGYFIPIRVEESQRPDIDLRYNQDGWPTIAFLTPQGDHLVSVNAMAPEPFADLLVRLHTLYRERRTEVQEQAARAQEEAARLREGDQASPPLGPTLVAELAGIIEGYADPIHGGYAGADGNKMLHPEANDFFLHLHETTGEAGYLDHVTLTLAKMRQSRTYDEVDGGFFRYSSKPDWREPHPEKLLADQARLLANYLHAYLVTERSELRETAEALVRYLDATLSDPATKAFYGCQDYVRPEEKGARQPSAGPAPLLSVIDRLIYTDANAQAISAYLDAAWVLNRPECKERALDTLEFLWQRLRAPDGGMYHYDDGAPHAPGMLTDAVAVGTALLDAFRVTGAAHYLDRARALADYIIRDHLNPAGGLFDIVTPGLAGLQYRLTVLAQNAAAATFFLRLAILAGEGEHRQAAGWALQAFTDTYRNYGAFAAGYGHALARLLARPLVLRIAGSPGDPRVRSLVRAGMTQLGQVDLVVRFDEGPGDPIAYLEDGARRVGPVTDPMALTPALVYALR